MDCPDPAIGPHSGYVFWTFRPAFPVLRGKCAKITVWGLSNRPCFANERPLDVFTNITGLTNAPVGG